MAYLSIRKDKIAACLLFLYIYLWMAAAFFWSVDASLIIPVIFYSIISICSFFFVSPASVDSKIVKFGLLVFLYLCISLTSSFLSHEPYKSLQRVALTYLPVAALITLFVASRLRQSQVVNLFFYIMMATIFLVFISLFLYIFGDTITVEGRGKVNRFIVSGVSIYQRQFGTFPSVRLGSLVNNPNNFGIWLFTGVASSLIAFLGNKIKATTFFVVLLILIIGFLLPFSRASFLALSVLMSVSYFSFFLIKRKGALFFILVLMCALFLVVLYLIKPLGVEVYDVKGTRLGLSLSARDVAWKVALKSFVDNPFVGVGFGLSGEVLIQQNLDISVHNVHLQILLELGLLGYIVFVVMYMYPIFVSWKFVISSASLNKKYIVSVLSAWLLAMFFHQLFENVLFRPGDIFTVIWLLVNLSILRLTSNDSACVVYRRV